MSTPISHFRNRLELQTRPTMSTTDAKPPSLRSPLPLPCKDVLGSDSSDDEPFIKWTARPNEPLVPVRKTVKPVDSPVKRERSATALAEPEPAYKAAREREDPINKMYDRVTAPNSPGNKASVATPPSSPGTANDDDVPKDPRLVAKLAKFAPEKASFTITSASPVTSPSRASTTRSRIPVPTTRSRMRTLKGHGQCK